MVFGMPRGLAVELSETADVVQGHRRLSQDLVIGVHRLNPGEVKHRPEQHRGVTVGEHKPVAVGPDGVLGVEAQDAIPDRVNQRCQRHRCAGVSGLGLLDRVYGEGADGVDRQLNHFIVAHGLFLSGCRISSFGPP